MLIAACGVQVAELCAGWTAVFTNVTGAGDFRRVPHIFLVCYVKKQFAAACPTSVHPHSSRRLLP